MEHDLPFAVADRRKRGYFTVDNIVLDTYGQLLKAHGIAVYNALARFANDDSECWPSRRVIKDKTGVSIAQINRELNKMVDLELIAITPQFNEEGDQTSNLYTLLEVQDAPPSLPDTPPVSRRDSPRIRQIPKQSLKKKDIQPNSKKKGGDKKNYRPAEYSDIILG